MSLFDIKSFGEVAFEATNATPADVAVIVPLYNYGRYIVQCLQSVAAQTLEPISVVVIDDNSTDDGLFRAIDFLKANATRFNSVRVIRHIRNLGVAMARNSGIVWSSEPLLFMLDADDYVRSPALARLKSAIDTSGADFAYSQIFYFGDGKGVGAADIWNADRLRHGTTIAAAALIRRSALLTAGGYVPLADDLGWEHYDLWCRFFTMGLRGVYLPELLCECRLHAESMLHTDTNKALASMTVEMALRHPQIFYPANESGA